MFLNILDSDIPNHLAIRCTMRKICGDILLALLNNNIIYIYTSLYFEP